MTNAMLIEIENKKNYLKKNEIHTIYFGGGTPSFIESKKLNELLEKIKSLYKIIEDAEITIELNQYDDQISAIIEDNGIGFGKLKTNIKDILNPYFTTKKNGTGLGLSIVNKIVNDHNGNIEFVQINDGAKIKINFIK